MKTQSKQEKILELFNPLIKQAIKEDKLIIDERDNMTYLPHYFKTLIESNSMLSPEENELTFFKTCERNNSGLKITTLIIDDKTEKYSESISKTIYNIDKFNESVKKQKEQIFEQIINQTTRMETIVKVRDLNAGKNKITTQRGMPKLNIGSREVTISKEGMIKLDKIEDFYFKLTIFEIENKQVLCISETEKDSSQAMFRKSKDGTKFICHRIILTDDIRDFFNIDKTKKFALSIEESINFENKEYFKLQLID